MATASMAAPILTETSGCRHQAPRVPKPSQDGERNPGFLWVRLSSLTTAHKENDCGQKDRQHQRPPAAGTPLTSWFWRLAMVVPAGRFGPQPNILNRSLTSR